MDKTILINSKIPIDRIELAENNGSLSSLEINDELSIKGEFFNAMPADIGIIGAGDFSIAFAASFKKDKKILIYDQNKIMSIFSEHTKISTNKSFSYTFNNNIHFVSDLKYLLKSKFILLGVPAFALPSVISDIKKVIPDTYKYKQYVLVSKGFIRKGYIPHKWLEKEGISFENIIWASGGNVAKDVIQKKSYRISVVSINKNRKNRKIFSSYFNKEYLVPEIYSGSALLACELGGILKNYYAGIGKYILLKHGEKVLTHYKLLVRSEFRKTVRLLSRSPKISIRAWVIKKASHGPSFWEDLDVTIRSGRNGYFGEYVFNKEPIGSVINKLGLVESFNSIFSALSIFNEVKQTRKIYILNKILSLYEDLHMQYLERKDSSISDDGFKVVETLEKYILSSMDITSKHGFINKLKNVLKLN